MPLQLTKLKTNLSLNPLFWIVDLTGRRECRIPNRPDGEGWRQRRYEAKFGRRFIVHVMDLFHHAQQNRARPLN
ncbi:unnamed protein product [Linum tenue]|uniref:Uncharacterized protein n=1 Tax=Linum tenue TaxID=586396 RepID=A0AAV0GYD6_9ROSI|nr:unnamed protein product [Linum tenue]